MAHSCTGYAVLRLQVKCVRGPEVLPLQQCTQKLACDGALRQAYQQALNLHVDWHASFQRQARIGEVKRVYAILVVPDEHFEGEATVQSVVPQWGLAELRCAAAWR